MVKKVKGITMNHNKAWKEFQKSGLLWWINRTLHLFGWAIYLVQEEDGSISGAFPARVKFRGFVEDDEEEGFRTLSAYLESNINDLKAEANLTTEGTETSAQKKDKRVGMCHADEDSPVVCIFHDDRTDCHMEANGQIIRHNETCCYYIIETDARESEDN